ncbi:nucleotidyltransferase domain-containing protein [Pseudomonas sp. LS-2]|jgi:predicted nucleotidyltransferase|uniref:nucleotidyltransferase domain-containing protein n=1 Tax=Pseudomonas sp. LS-2 TaxID=2315859 RepID=UPI000E722076|nr:nucleotidyltransferase domain-containing protein [Pseudomonas sp. LS-2]RJX75933.1 MarR family transcriptional regulator [Pseudomonas sp. LS-2]
MSIADALFTTTQQRLLGLLYGNPDRSFYTNEIGRSAQVGKGSVVRELDRLLSAGLLTATRQGNQIHYQANPDSPVFGELVAIVRKTFGIADHLRQALIPLADHIQRAFVYGSIAKGTANTSSDIDLMLIAEGISYSEVMERMIPLEESLGRTINPTLYTPADWQAKLESGNSFVVRVAEQDKIEVIGQT